MCSSLYEWGLSWFFIVHWSWKDEIFSFPVSLWALTHNVQPGQYPEVAPLKPRHLLRTEELSIIVEKNQVFLWARNCAWMHAMWWSHCWARLQIHSSWLSQLFHSSSCLIQSQSSITKENLCVCAHVWCVHVCGCVCVRVLHLQSEDMFEKWGHFSSSSTLKGLFESKDLVSG